MQGWEQNQVSQWGMGGGNLHPFEPPPGVAQHNPFLSSQPGVNTEVSKQKCGKMCQQAEGKPQRRNETRDRLKKHEAMLEYLHDQTVQIITNQEQAAKRENQLLAYAADLAQKQTAILQNCSHLSEVMRGYQPTGYSYPAHHGQ